MGTIKLGVSNLAWESKSDLLNIESDLSLTNIKYLEIVIPKFVNWNALDLSEITSFVNSMKEKNIDILSTQSIFFGSNIESFHSVDFIPHIEMVFSISNKLGIKHAVLGSPSMRNIFIVLPNFI